MSHTHKTAIAPGGLQDEPWVLLGSNHPPGGQRLVWVLFWFHPTRPQGFWGLYISPRMATMQKGSPEVTWAKFLLSKFCKGLYYPFAGLGQAGLEPAF